MPSVLSYFDALKYLLPEVALTLGLCTVLVWDLLDKEKRWRETGFLSLGFLVLAGLLLVQRLGWASADVFGMVTVDRFATIFKLFITAAVAVVIGFDLLDRRTPREGKGETYFLLLTAALGGYFLVGTYNLLLLYLGLETLGLSSYALAGMVKRDRAGAESALKYVIYGALASGILIFGASFLYGMSGSLDVRRIAPFILQAVEGGHAVQVALPTLLILVGFGFKLSVFPFQWWAPDVYQGVSTPVATFLAVGSKGVAVGGFLRYLAGAYAGVTQTEIPLVNAPGFRHSLVMLLALVSAATMIFGNLAAIRQTNLKRLLAYSSVAHAGYILMGIALLDERGFEAATLYIFVYYFMNLGAFGAVIYFANQTGNEEIDGLRGLGRQHPVAGIAFVVFLVSLTGLPPTAGFAGKWYLLLAALDGGLAWLALILVIMSVVSLFYYFRIVKTLYLREARPGGTKVRSPLLGGMLAALAAASIFFLWFDPLLALARSGVQNLF